MLVLFEEGLCPDLGGDVITIDTEFIDGHRYLFGLQQADIQLRGAEAGVDPRGTIYNIVRRLLLLEHEKKEERSLQGGWTTYLS
jgi:hypothetical protein